jgi:hypothetical protein
MRKPNYSLERKERERAKQAKAAAKLDKRGARSADARNEATAGMEKPPLDGAPVTPDREN